MEEQIKGYDYGKVGQSPVSIAELELLKKTVLFTAEDEKNLRLVGEVLKDQTNEVLDLWYGFVGGNEHLLHYFGKNEKPNMEYLTAVRARFGQWIMDLCNKPYDQTWLNYQHEIALRHHSTKKNKTDGVDTVPIIHYRYMTAFIYPITATIKGFLSKKGHDTETVEAMYSAWFKAVTLTVILWTYPYINENEF
ncbi:protoglobin domain-containing protein [Flavobacterium sp. K5-23]|uniref:protoglobin domain-containing protein n=1 Tax=Flavobacterium sp. K5-23 TaxID=2746225 RepID=UPI00200D87C6|nr:protoglobin domain-containing protein [Flavobacterium sp. K5-23]UQD56959.1 protogloblin ApPgb [Flavobacterium sp. K5-23]